MKDENLERRKVRELENYKDEKQKKTLKRKIAEKENYLVTLMIQFFVRKA